MKNMEIKLHNFCGRWVALRQLLLQLKIQIKKLFRFKTFALVDMRSKAENIIFVRFSYLFAFIALSHPTLQTVFFKIFCLKYAWQILLEYLNCCQFSLVSNFTFYPDLLTFRDCEQNKFITQK